MPWCADPRLTKLATENKAMNKYIIESLTASLIHPSSSTAGAGFFFMEKKDAGYNHALTIEV